MTTKYFNVKQGITTGNIVLDGITGNISANNANLGNALVANFFIGDGGFLANITGGNVVGQVGNSLIAGTVYTNAQPNITSVGTLSNLSVTGNLSSGNANLGNLATANFFHGVFDATSSSQPNITSVGNLSNLTVGNATSNVVLLDGNITATGTITANNFVGNFSGNVTVGGTNTQVLFNNNGEIDGSNAFTFNNVSNVITIGGNLVTNNANLGNAVTANYFTGNFYGTANSATTAGTVTTNAQPNITSVGTLSNLDVSGNITGANVIANTAVFSPNLVQNASTYDTRVTLGSGSGIIEITSNGNSTQFKPTGEIGLGGVSTLSGGTFGGSQVVLGTTQTDLKQLRGGNVTVQVGTGGSTADTWTFAQSGAFEAPGLVNAVGNINGANLTTGGVLSVTGNANVGNLGTNNLIATGTGSFGANVNMNTYWINNVGYPNLSSDAATKEYVDTMVSTGIAYHQPVYAATNTTLATATGGTVSYNNGTLGVGATLTTTGTFNLIDTANVQTVGTRILVKNEANAAWNGIYEYTSATVITRTADADEYGPDSTEQLSINDYFFVQGGNVNQGTAYIVSAPAGTITFGTSNITFAEFSSSRVYTAGTGLTLSGTQFSISNTTVANGSYGSGDSVGTFTVNDQGQLTAASNTAITANAANLTGTTLASTIVTSSLTSVGILANLAVSGDITSGNVYANSGAINASTLGGNLTTNAQPNITSVGTLSSLSVTGNIAGGNLNTSGTANVGALLVSGTSNLGPVSNVTITGGSNGYYLQTNGSGTLTWAAVPSGSGISNGTSNVNIPVADGNVNITASGNTTMVITGTGANIDGYANVTGNLSAANLTLASGGNISGVNNLSATTLTGTLTTASQPNITSVGTLVGLTVSNASGAVDFTGVSNVSLGPVSNVHITGGSADQYLKTDGSGALSWATVDTSIIANGTSNVSIPSVNGNINLVSAGNTTLVVTGTGANITGTANITGNLIAANANLGNLVNANFFSGDGSLLSNISGGNVSGTVANATYAVSAGSATTAGTVTTNAQPNITSVGTLTSLDVTGNISGGNINTTGTANVGTLIVTGTTNFGNLSANYVALNNGLTSNRTNVSVTTNTVVDQFAPSTFRTAKYIISASGDDGYQSVETLLIHDGTSAYITIYGSICSNNTADIIELSSNINSVSGNVAVYATGSSANLKVNIVATYIQT